MKQRNICFNAVIMLIATITSLFSHDLLVSRTRIIINLNVSTNSSLVAIVSVVVNVVVGVVIHLSG
ncbi:hypothetical protein A2U01_0103880, partial [Trifolium medium]|nr:hypothetical protein [Trifolium medium]